MKILVATEKPFAPVAIEKMKSIVGKKDFDLVLLEKYTEKSMLVEAVKDADALIIRSDKIGKEVFDEATKLKIVVRAGAGYDNIDLKAASDKEVVVMNTPGQNANAVAELALGMMVYQIRNQFNGTAGTELRNKKMGIHGYGHVGRITGMIARGFGMVVSSYNPYISKIIIENDGVVYEDTVEGLYRGNQYISVSLPLDDTTKGLVNYDLLSLMPPNAMLVNTARREVLDDESLLKMFAERPDFQFISDIAPNCRPEIEKNYPGRYFFTPKKMGAQTAEANINAGVAAAHQVVDFLINGKNKFQVNQFNKT